MSYNKETGIYEGFIYKIYNDINDKIYIGQTIVNVQHRYICHLCDAKNKNDNMAIHKAMRKYGYDNFHIETLEIVTSYSRDELLELLNTKEQNYIENLQTIRPNGYNISIGGGNIVFNEKKVYQYDTHCKLINIFKSIKIASDMTGIGMYAISKCCLHKSKTAGGYVFLFEGENPYNAESQEKIINQYSIDDKFIKTYSSILDASFSLGVDGPSVTNCCRKKRYKTVGGFKWYYADDLDQPDKTKIINLN